MIFCVAEQSKSNIFNGNIFAKMITLKVLFSATNIKSKST